MTDVERSTRLWEDHPDAMGGVIERHDSVVGDIVARHGGTLIRSKGEGDSTFSVFEDAVNAVSAAADLQRALRTQVWPEAIDLRVRAALYTGVADERDGDYYGTGPNRAARLRAVAHGGQTICCSVTVDSLRGQPPPDITLRDLGLHRLRDVSRAERVYQVNHPDLPDEFPPLASLGVRHNLPEPRTTFVGREDDLVAVSKHLASGRLVTLVGVGGCGKTRLAIEVARDLLEHYPDGVFFVDLAPVNDPHVVGGTVAAAVGFSRMALGTGSGRPATEMIDFLSSRESLVVLDNCEHVIDACASLADEILECCPEVSILATSREALRLRGEQIHPVAPLRVPDGSTGEGSEASLLFAERARSVRRGFELTVENSGDVAEICRRLDGIPLAIELAAAQIAYLSPAQIVERLEDRLQLSAGRQRTKRQQTLEAALDWSHDLLSGDERRVLRRLSVFPGSFTIDAADSVCGTPVFHTLGSLIAKSLVVAGDDGDVASRRYRLLETVRLYAAAKLAEVGEDEQVRDAHRDLYLEWLESFPPEVAYLDLDGKVRTERHNLRAALTWSEQQGRIDLVGRLAAQMNAIWITDIREGRRWTMLALEALDELDQPGRVRVLTAAAVQALLAMEAADGTLARQAVEASEGRAGVWSSLAHALLCLNAGIHYFLGRQQVYADEVEELGRKALLLAPGEFNRAMAWQFLGQARVLTGDLDGAIEGLAKGSVAAVESGDLGRISLAMLAGVLHVVGRDDEAFETARRVVDTSSIKTSDGQWAWALYSALPYAIALGQRGRHADALTFVRDLIDENATPRTPGVMSSVIIALGALAQQRGDHAVAGPLLEYSTAALLRDGVRTPVDIAILMHYTAKVQADLAPRDAQRYRDLAMTMSTNDAIELGLRPAAVG